MNEGAMKGRAKMMKIFAEYRVHEQQRAAYLGYVQELKALYARVRVYEGLGQPGLYVEEWEDYSESFYAQLTEERAATAHPLWSQLDDLVIGGRSKTNMWMFREI